MPGEHDERLASLQEIGPGPLMEKLGLEWVSSSEERLVARIPVEGNQQPFGLFHGGASAALTETLASIMTWLIDPTRVSMGIEVKVNHLRPVTSGYVTGTCVPIRAGRTVQVYEVRMQDDEGRDTALGICTTMTRKA
jgi:uncharacterized protein (TIGR00369 family)